MRVPIRATVAVLFAVLDSDVLDGVYCTQPKHFAGEPLVLVTGEHFDGGAHEGETPTRLLLLLPPPLPPPPPPPLPPLLWDERLEDESWSILHGFVRWLSMVRDLGVRVGPAPFGERCLSLSTA